MPPPRLALDIGTYLTDGLNLYRVERHLAGRAGVLFELEDCATLSLVAWPRVVLDSLGMRVVRAGRR